MKFEYTNYKGETEERDVDVTSIDYISNPGFGYEPGWFLTGRDRERNGAVRSFRLDQRMAPLGPAMHRHPGLTLCEYPITEGHAVRETVEQLQKLAVEREIDQKRAELAGKAD